MAFTATAVGRVRVSGSDLNGAFYDAGIASAGIDYSQQDATQLALSDCTSTNSTTITSVTGGFTAAMIGNAIRLNSGTGVTVGYYFIITRVDTNTITVDRVSGTYTAGVGKVGGAAATVFRLLNSSNATGDKVVPGNIVYVQGSGSDTPGADDYTMTSFIVPVAGTSSLWVKLIGENGRPRLKSDGLMFFGAANYFWAENLYLTTSSNSNGSLGIIGNMSFGTFKNLVIDTANKAVMAGLVIVTYCLVEDVEIKSGTTSPTSSSTSYGISITSHSHDLLNVRIHHMRDEGVHIATNCGGVNIENSLIYGTVSHGINEAGAPVIGKGVIRGCTFDNNGGDAIHYAAAASILAVVIRSNIFSNHTGVGKYGINVAAGTAAANDLIKRIVNYNCYFNNTANFNGISAGANDTQGTDPQYTDATNGDFTIGTNLKAKGWPGTWRGQATPIGYMDPGAVQRQEASSGGGPVGNNMRGGFSNG